MSAAPEIQAAPDEALIAELVARGVLTEEKTEVEFYVCGAYRRSTDRRVVSEWERTS